MINFAKPADAFLHLSVARNAEPQVVPETLKGAVQTVVTLSEKIPAEKP